MASSRQGISLSDTSSTHHTVAAKLVVTFLYRTISCADVCCLSRVYNIREAEAILPSRPTPKPMVPELPSASNPHLVGWTAKLLLRLSILSQSWINVFRHSREMRDGGEIRGISLLNQSMLPKTGETVGIIGKPFMISTR